MIEGYICVQSISALPLLILALFFSLFRTIFELKDFVETKSRETDYEALKGGCVKVRNEYILPSLFNVSFFCYHLVDFFSAIHFKQDYVLLSIIFGS